MYMSSQVHITIEYINDILHNNKLCLFIYGSKTALPFIYTERFTFYHVTFLFVESSENLLCS